MYFAIAAVALAALSQTTHANPLFPVAARVNPMASGVTTAAHFPVHDLARVDAQPKVTLASASASAAVSPSPDVADATFPASLLLCPVTNCLSCFQFDLSTVPENVCLIDQSSTFVSLAIIQASNEGLPFEVLVGPPGCLSFGPVPAVNECFNVNSTAPFQDFAILTQ